MAAVRCLVLLGLCGLAWSQGDLPTDIGSTLTRVQEFDASIGFRSEMELDAVYDSGRFNSSVARDARNLYFNCIERNSTGGQTFPDPASLAGNTLSIFFQMPNILYLDYEVRAVIMRALNEAIFSNQDANRLCIYRSVPYNVGYFEEGVLVTFYDRNQVGTTPSGLSGEGMRDMFNSRYATLSYFESYMGATTLNMLGTDLYQETGQYRPSSLSVNDLPPRDTLREVVTEDPNTVRSRAIIVYMGTGEVPRMESKDFADNLDFVENPNPVNFYLYAGDYVFAVIGSILVFSVLVVCIFGYFIHPAFFL